MSSAQAEEVIGFGDHLALEGLLSSALPEARKRLQSAVERQANLKAELDQAERVLAAIPDPESLGAAESRRGRTRGRPLMRAEAAHTVATEMLTAAAADRAKATAAYESALDKAAHANLAADDDRRLVEHVDRVRETLDGLRVAATDATSSGSRSSSWKRSACCSASSTSSRMSRSIRRRTPCR